MGVIQLTRMLKKPADKLTALNWSGLGRYSSLSLALLGLASGIVTYLVLSNLTPIAPTRESVWGLLSINIFIICGLLIMLGVQAIRLRRRQRAGRAGAYMHGRMVTLFSAIAAFPAILVAIFAIVTMDRGLDYWFSARTKTIITNTTAVANAYLAEQRESLRHDVTMMAQDLAAVQDMLDTNPQRFMQFIQAQTGLRKIPQALIINDQGDVLVAASPEETILTTLPRPEAFSAARNNTVILTATSKAQILGLRKISGTSDLYLYATRILSANVMQQLVQTEAAVRDYSAMERRRFETQLTFALIYIVMTLVILLSAIWLGLSLADRLVIPIGRLIYAARRLGEGDLQSRVRTTATSNGEIDELAETFNEMAERLGSQQNDLDERARFTETVLHGVSSGVVGIDENGVINHANEAAGELYEVMPNQLIGQPLALVMPDFVSLLEGAEQMRGLVTEQVNLPHAKTKGLTIQASAACIDGPQGGVVITFDDVTDLLTAQRNAAWSDIARRIAHEIKNPLTPIQLSAERLQFKYGNDVGETADIFRKCTETIIRQVEDIGQMVDEFAAFARMPTAVMGSFNLNDVLTQAVLLQRVAQRDVEYRVECPDKVIMHGDRRLISQALTNILKNAGEAAMLGGDEKFIEITVQEDAAQISVAIADSGPGWPEKDRYALLEPYNTSREEGTGLGLSIVKKVIEDHGGKLKLEDAPWCLSGGTGAKVQMVFPLLNKQMAGQSRELEEL